MRPPMLEIPFDIVRCSWPLPVRHADGRWLSSPEWDAPEMPYRPQPQWQMIDGELCWTIDWREFFKSWLKPWDYRDGGEMRGFHIVFHLRLRAGGRLVFWDDDGCVIRRDGEVVHRDPSAHMLTRSEITVREGDLIEVAQWQLVGGWLWGARLAQPGEAQARWPMDVVLEHLDAVRARLAHPGGPPLKIFCDGRNPARTVVAVYSMILNGYAPSGVWLFGEHQWDTNARHAFARALPFATVVPTADVIRRLDGLGGPRLTDLARRYWFVMKTFVSLLCPPEEFCLMDDDVVILDDVADALAAFQRNDLVFAPDTDHGRTYLATWGWMHGDRGPLRTGTFNAGLYWLRASHDPRKIAVQALRVRPGAAFVWEQGFIANLYAHGSAQALPTQRYFYPLFDGMPGGPLGYDYGGNPCGFASVHFGGLAEKPSDVAMRDLAPDILGRRPDR